MGNGGGGGVLGASFGRVAAVLEAHVNSIADEFATRSGLAIHEQALLLEREVGLEDGQFRLRSGLKMARLEDRIEFLHSKFSGKPLDRASPWWDS